MVWLHFHIVLYPSEVCTFTSKTVLVTFLLASTLYQSYLLDRWRNNSRSKSLMIFYPNWMYEAKCDHLMYEAKCDLFLKNNNKRISEMTIHTPDILSMTN